ncbi:MAG: hypothetical protein ACLRVN_04840 [Butyricicoccus sp.]
MRTENADYCDHVHHRACTACVICQRLRRRLGCSAAAPAPDRRRRRELPAPAFEPGGTPRFILLK